MYITEINGRQAAYYDDRLEIGDLTIPYREMMSITHAFEDAPVFRFKYKGFDFTVACKEDEYQKVLEYFRKAAELSPDTDPLDMLNSARDRSARREAEARQAQEAAQEQKTAGPTYTYNYNYYGNTRNDSYYDDGSEFDEGVRHIPKSLFVWVCSFLFGVVGVDRFVRGQIGLGLLKLFTGGCWGFLYLFDLAEAIIKAYGSAYRDSDYFHFNADGSYTR